MLRRLPAYMLERSVDLPRLISSDFGRESVEELASLVAPAVLEAT